MQVTYDNLRAYAYALGYYDGRLVGYENNVFEDDLDRHSYKQGYDAGVTDYCNWDTDAEEEN